MYVYCVQTWLLHRFEEGVKFPQTVLTVDWDLSKFSQKTASAHDHWASSLTASACVCWAVSLDSYLVSFLFYNVNISIDALHTYSRLYTQGVKKKKKKKKEFWRTLVLDSLPV